MITVRDLFDVCEDIELRNAKLYAAFMIRLGSDDGRVAQFWEDMSREEWEHYIILNFGRDLCERASMMGEPVREIDRGSLDAAANIIKEMEGQVGAADYTLPDAFEMAVASEGSEGDEFFLHLVGLIRRAIDRLEEYHLEARLQKIDRKVDDHLDGLIQAIIRLGDDPDLVRRARDILSRRPTGGPT